jgi:hypothetical protein
MLFELHMNFVPVDFVVMDMRSNTSRPIILGRPFLEQHVQLLTPKKGM